MTTTLAATAAPPAATPAHPPFQPRDASICHVMTTGSTDSSSPSAEPYTTPSQRAAIPLGPPGPRCRGMRETISERNDPASTAPRSPQVHPSTQKAAPPPLQAR